MKLILLTILFTISSLPAAEVTDRIFGALPTEKFSYHEPTYFVFGDDDLKLQYSFKYRLSRNLDIYFAYTQVMFWSIYEESRPFHDVNYRPEVFYRLVDQAQFLKSIDLGFWHLSNGQDGEESRSLDQVFVRATFLGKINRNTLGAVLRVFNVSNEDETNESIINHLGYWELSAFLTELLSWRKNSVAFHLRTYAGSKIYDLDKGGLELGLIYFFKDSAFNPAIYLQRFEGYAENLKDFEKKRTEYRLGLLLAY